MRLCRFRRAGVVTVGFYGDDHVLALAAAVKAYGEDTGETIALSATGDDLLPLLPGGEHFGAASKLAEWVGSHADELKAGVADSVGDVELLVPIAVPKKIFCLAGNYSQHIEEGGGVAPERAETFPYVFMKPPTTLTDPGKQVEIPKVSPDAIDWELELAIVIGRTVKHATAADALDSVAGYTVVNDISNRRFRPNPERKERPKDTFFDWLHGKWFDSFCPVGPCITSAAAIADPQTLDMKLRLNGEVRQDSSTAAQIFSVAEVIEFVSQMVTLEPGDIISTGTPAGVGAASGTFLKPGDVLEATIAEIGTLRSLVVAEG
jgi:2,4-diketo-3-deoxy-L-fuconate hydrolase